MVLVQTGRVHLALTEFQEATRLKPDWPVPPNTMAWLLATHPDHSVRSAEQAVRLAERAAELTNHRHPATLDTLAAACAEAGQFERAVTFAESAMAIAGNAGGLAAQIRGRLELYRQQKLYRDPTLAQNGKSSERQQ